MERVYGKSFGSLWKILELYSYFLLLMLMKRLMNWRPLVKNLFLLSLHYTFVTRRWKDLSLFHYWVQHFPTWSPLAISVIIFTHIDNLLQVCGNFIILAPFDSYNTIKAIEISCIKAFYYSEHIEGMLYCWKKRKFVSKWERDWIIKLLDMYTAPKKKRNMNVSQNTKER